MSFRQTFLPLMKTPQTPNTSGFTTYNKRDSFCNSITEVQQAGGGGDHA